MTGLAMPREVDQSEPAAPHGRVRTVERMRCVECEREKAQAERGWMTVLSPSGSLRIHYCPACVADLVRRADAIADDDDE